MNNDQVNIDKGMRRLRPALIAAVLLQAGPCWAAVTVATSASARAEYDSNVFDLQSGSPVPGTTDFQRSDRLYTYGAALSVNYLWDRQKLFATLSDNEFHYDHFTQLDHNEYNLDAGLNWKLARLFDGTLEVQRNRTMVAFTNVNDAQFVVQTEQREAAKVGLQIMPEWRIEGSGFYRTAEQLFVNAPTLDLRESSATVAVHYLGRAGLTAGLSGGFTHGDYAGPSAALKPSYRQHTFSVTAIYAPTGRSTFNGVLGYSDRTSSSALNTISGFTGELDYDYQLTGKTSMHGQISRAINSYIANVSSEIDSTAAYSVRWQATYRLAVVAGYNWTTRELPGQGNLGVDSNRSDHLQYVSLNMDYRPFRWLSLKPYLNYQTRNSNFIGGNFNASVYGILFTVQWQNQRQPDSSIQRLNLPTAIH